MLHGMWKMKGPASSSVPFIPTRHMNTSANQNVQLVPQSHAQDEQHSRQVTLLPDMKVWVANQGYSE